jgi:hypothetical protein
MQLCIQHFISQENAGKASVGVAALPGASACKLWQETLSAPDSLVASALQETLSARLSSRQETLSD